MLPAQGPAAGEGERAQAPMTGARPSLRPPVGPHPAEPARPATGSARAKRSGYVSTCRHGFDPSGRMPRFSFTPKPRNVSSHRRTSASPPAMASTVRLVSFIRIPTRLGPCFQQRLGNGCNQGVIVSWRDQRSRTPGRPSFPRVSVVTVLWSLPYFGRVCSGAPERMKLGTRMSLFPLYNF